MDERNENTQRYLFISIIVLALTHFAVQLSLVAKGVEFIVANLTIDDTYYYLQTAWNTAHSGFVTFDGIHATNGVQLLWFWLITAIAVFLKAKASFLPAILIFCFLLNVSCYLVIWRIGAVLRSPWLALVITLFWSVEIFSGTYFIGVENSLHALIIWCVIWQLAAVAAGDKISAKRHFYILTFLLIANVWTRLDAALFSLTIFAFCIALLRRKYDAAGAFYREYAKATAFGTGAAIIGMTGMFLLYHRMGGSVLPVSALVKLTSQRELGSFVQRIHESYTLSIPHILTSPLRTDSMRAVIGIGSLFAVFGLSRFASSSICGNCRNARIMLFGLVVSYAAYNAVIVAMGIWNASYFVWYRSPLYIFWIFAFAFAAVVCVDLAAKMIARLLQSLRTWSVSNHIIAARISVILIMAIAMFTLSHCGISYSKRMNSSTLDTPCGIYYGVARWMAANVPDDAVCASWSAGVVGYFSDRRMINLDGLANSFEYYRTVIGGDVELREYLNRNDVEYIVDYIDYLSMYPSLKLTVVYTSRPDKWGHVVMKVSKIEAQE